MRKRILSTLLTLCMVAGLLPAEALAAERDVPSAENQPYFADEWPSEDKFAEFDGETEDAGISAQAASATDIAYPVTDGNIYFDASSGTITNCDESVTAAVIPSTINGVAVISIGIWAFSGCSSLTSITIPGGIASIGDYAFSRCDQLTSISIPAGVTSIGNSAFSYCSGLTGSITIPAGVTSIGDSAFYVCSGLTGITIPAGVTSIGNSAFSHCSGLTGITIPSGVTSIGDGAFDGCSGLTGITIPDGVTSIGRSTFSDCSGLTSITIPDGVTSIGDWAFNRCSGLTGSITIPSGVTSIGDGTFHGCSGLTGITIPVGVTSIGDWAFDGCSGLTDITIPAVVTSIGNGAFSGCSGLTGITIPVGVTSIGDKAFKDCSGLASITIPAGVTSIGDGTFSWCSGLTSITIPAGVTSIGAEAFSYCRGLTSITIPAGVTSIGNGAFWGCSGLTGSITIPAGVTSIEDRTFSWCSGLTSITIPAGVTSIGEFAFDECSGLTNITIPDGVTSIGNGTFRYCRGLTRITIPDSVTNVEKYAFCATDKLADIYYSGTEAQWNKIEISTYENSNAPLLNATIHYNSTGPGMGGAGETLENKTASGVLRSGDGCRVLWQCSYQVGEDNQPRNGNIRIFTSSTDTVEEELYLYNENVETGFPYPWELEPYNIPKSAVTSLTIRGEAQKLLLIPAGAFQGYTNLKQASLTCVSTIDTGAFSGCAALQSVGFPNQTLKVIGREAFKGTDLGRVTLEESVTTIGENAFAGCENILIRCYENSVAHQYVVANGIPFELIVGEKKNIPFYSPTGNKTTELDIDWGWDLFQLPTYQYHHQLAALGMILSAAAEEDTPARAVALYNELGFEDVKPENYGFSIFEVQHPAVVFAHHQEAGKHILIITVRGTNGNEWEDIITDISPQGFINSAKNIYSQFDTFLTENGLSASTLKGRTKVLVTGHSLGGATANALTKTLNNEYGLENVFVYTFAAPRPYTVWDAEKISNVYNAFNIVNEEDIVPKLKNVWTLQRIGTDLPPFHRNTTDGFYENFKLLTGREFIEGGNNVKGDSAHDVAVYMAYVLSRANGTIKPVQFPQYIVVRIACPVDVEVYDSNQELVGQVSDNQVVSVVPDKIQIYVEGDEKQIVLIGDDDYNFKMIGTDTGTMTYSVYHVDGTTQKINSEKIFDNVALVNGKHFTSHVSVWDKEDETIDASDKTDVPEVKLYVLGSNNEPEKEVLSDGNGTEVPITDPVRPTVPVNPDNMPPHSTGGYSSGGSTNTGHTITISSGITGGTVTANPKSAAKGVTVTLATSPNEGYELERLTVADASGNELELTEIGNGVYAFTMPGSRVTVDAVFTVVSPEKPEPPATPSIHASFTDVQPGAYYADAVAWAVEQGITAGTSTTTFSPDASCTRGQMVTFLWRASGSPAPRGSANPFTDVQLGAYYYDAVLWAAEQGITSGTSATAFSPNAIVSRGQAVTFLYRAAGSPAAVGSTSFGDVASGAYYTDAVQWAVSRGVTVGTRGTTFSPDSDCSRAQIATFLYRDRVN